MSLANNTLSIVPKGDSASSSFSRSQLAGIKSTKTCFTVAMSASSTFLSGSAQDTLGGRRAPLQNLNLLCASFARAFALAWCVWNSRKQKPRFRLWSSGCSCQWTTQRPSTRWFSSICTTSSLVHDFCKDPRNNVELSWERLTFTWRPHTSTLLSSSTALAASSGVLYLTKAKPLQSLPSLVRFTRTSTTCPARPNTFCKSSSVTSGGSEPTNNSCLCTGMIGTNVVGPKGSASFLFVSDSFSFASLSAPPSCAS
mmetsp:Transcript_18407/g.35026  ORF Transcript_18407/g.35026 Transcript_18407/m.35026 type:complete len:255 (-) Transcript_18407:218-982(-)